MITIVKNDTGFYNYQRMYTKINVAKITLALFENGRKFREGSKAKTSKDHLRTSQDKRNQQLFLLPEVVSSPLDFIPVDYAGFYSGNGTTLVIGYCDHHPLTFISDNPKFSQKCHFIM